MALNQIQTVAKEMGKEKEITYSVLRGPIAASVLEYAKHDIDLIGMGTEGRTGLERLVIGSVTERVVRETPFQSLRYRLRTKHQLRDPYPPP